MAKEGHSMWLVSHLHLVPIFFVKWTGGSKTETTGPWFWVHQWTLRVVTLE